MFLRSCISTKQLLCSVEHTGKVAPMSWQHPQHIFRVRFPQITQYPRPLNGIEQGSSWCFEPGRTAWASSSLQQNELLFAMCMILNADVFSCEVVLLRNAEWLVWPNEWLASSELLGLRIWPRNALFQVCPSTPDFAMQWTDLPKQRNQTEQNRFQQRKRLSH